VAAGEYKLRIGPIENEAVNPADRGWTEQQRHLRRESTHGDAKDQFQKSFFVGVAPPIPPQPPADRGRRHGTGRAGAPELIIVRRRRAGAG
jgi:hypothetical protein